jgi:hypothetical protein
MRDRFRDWNLYHKTIMVVLAAITFGTLVRAILVFDTAFQLTNQKVVEASPSQIWLWMTGEALRDDWQAELISVVSLSGDTIEKGTTRLMFWQRGFKRWQSAETTLNLIPERVLVLRQDSDIDTRWVTMSLEVISECKTRVTIDEIIEPSNYADRFWFFNERDLHEARIETSLNDLGRWLQETDSACQQRASTP